MNDVVCATEVIGSFPGAARISETNKIWFMSTLYMGYRYGMLRMAETAPIGENCEKLFDVPVAGGWAVQASAQTAIDTASAEADVLVWVESDAVQEVIKIMQSLSVS